jgi:cytochrome c oxidase cbb3-type subunit III
MPTKIEKDAISGRETTGHEWDGIKELNTPLPKWWLYTLYATIVWSFGFYLLYPSFPTLRSHFPGIVGFWSRAEVRDELAAQNAQRAPFMNRIRSASLDQIRGQPDLFNFALTGGRAAFADNCAPCHGAGGSGARGFPNLADDDWLWGGDLDSVHRSISYGVRNANPDSQQSQMPRFGTDGLLTAAQISDVAEYVLAQSGRAKDAVAAGRGATLFGDNCADCHGRQAQGNTELGAPNLRDGIWLYGGERADIVQSITSARAGSMPAWAERLDEATVKMLAIYVHALGGGR